MTTIDIASDTQNIVVCSVKLNEQIHNRACRFSQVVTAKERFNLLTEIVETLLGKAGGIWK